MIKFEQEYQTTVYISATGCLVVEQTDCNGQIESVVIKDKKRAYAVIRAMKIILQSPEFKTHDGGQEKA